MAVPDTDDTNSSPFSNSPAARPSWETAPRPAARPAPAPQPAPRPAPAPQPAPRPAPAPPSASPYYAAPSAAPPPTYAPPAPSAYAPDTDIQYDLAGNPIPSSAPATAAPALAAPFGYAAGNAAPGVWPPTPTSPYGRQTGENGTDRVARLKWNWGAFFIPFWWSIFNGQKGIAGAIFLVNALNRVIPAPYDWGVDIASLGIQVYLGAMGHRLAWSSDRFAGDYDSFIRTQRAWMIWGFVVAGLIIVGLILAVALIPGFLDGLAGASQHHPTYTNGGSSSGNSSSTGQ